MNKNLWINIFDNKRKEQYLKKQKQGLSFIEQYSMSDYKTVLYELWNGFAMIKGSPTSAYTTFITPNNNEVLKLRISDHQSSPQEWMPKEVTGLPNRRYSIVVFSIKSMKEESKNDIKIIPWKTYASEGIPVYEICFNRHYLNETFGMLKNILISILKGGHAERIQIQSNTNTPSNSNRNVQQNNQSSNNSLQDNIKVVSRNRKRNICLTESEFCNIVTETVRKHIHMLTESQESKSLDQAKKLYMQRMNASREEARDFISKLQHDIPSLQHEAQKFTLGAARMFLDRQLTTAEDINSLNTTLRLLSKQYYNKFDRNLNSLSAGQLIGQFCEEIQQNQANMRNDVEGGNYNGRSDYKIVPINSFEDAGQYSRYTDWCITHMNNMWNNYTKGGNNQVYFCLKNGFEQVPEQPTEGCPLDDYGLSMISVIVDDQGNLEYCTSRWNHKQGGDADHIMNEKQISEVVGVNFYQTFKPNNKFQTAVENALQRLRNGENPKDVFNDCFVDKDGCIRVSLNNKCNMINQELKFVLDRWVDWIDVLQDDGSRIVQDNKHRENLINQDGQILLPVWVDWIDDFEADGNRTVRLNNRTYIIRVENGKLKYSNLPTSESKARLTNILTEEVFRRFKRKLLQL